MSTRYARKMKAQGSERFLKVGPRLFTFHHMGSGLGRELSEVLDSDGHTISVLPGYVRGQNHFGFPMLASAALDRKYAMQSTDPYRRRKFIERAYQNLDTAARDFPRPGL